MHKITRLIVGSFISIALIITSGNSLAASLDVDCSFGAALPDLTTSIACENYSGLNDTQAIIAANDPFGITDWTLAAKSDGPDGDGMLSLSGVVNGDTSGTWSVLPGGFKGYTDVFLTLKAGNGFAAYLLDTNFTSGEWITTGLDGKDLSHMSVYYSPTVVPVPAAFWLFGTALIGFIGFSRRTKV